MLAVIVAVMALPAQASAHGPVDPSATSFLARISHAPPGVEAKVVDGDQRVWMRVNPQRTVTVLDYRQAPYLRFTAAGVQVNGNSEMFYLNQVPPETPPPGLGPQNRPHWISVSSGHAYEWHDGRLSDLAATTLTPGATYLGQWRIALRVDGAPAVLAGGLTYQPSPSIVWFWPIIVCLACVLAVLRLRRPQLDLRVARALAAVALTAFAVAGAGQQLHGRPSVSVGQELTLAVALAFVAWGARRLVLRRHGWFTFFAIAAVAIWEGASLISVLFDGFVLLALPPVVARAAVLACLSCGVSLLALIFAMAEGPVRGRARPGAGQAGERVEATEAAGEDREAWQPSA
ncbi:MAG TPA: hypothetical protein VG325_03765 [Solirubrobacteraceae bacterium]|nr:hypothetical protein [Solirubrobacteraceae bacterium]